MKGSNHIPQPINTGEEKLIEKITQHLKAHLESDLKVTVVATLFDISPATLQHLFNKYIHQSFQHYVEDTRMTLAFELLMQGKRIKEIMQATGYTYRPAFNKAFLKKYKYPPSHFRK
ncbi:MAG: AraC family transcriptional regulator [Ferruginibacter sp.]